MIDCAQKRSDSSEQPYVPSGESLHCRTCLSYRGSLRSDIRFAPEKHDSRETFTQNDHFIEEFLNISFTSLRCVDL
jgi:hypothetical protein